MRASLSKLHTLNDPAREGGLFVPGFVDKELMPNGEGSGWVPQRGRLFKLDFPSAKFWVKIFFGVGGSQSRKTPPPVINEVNFVPPPPPPRCISCSLV